MINPGARIVDGDLLDQPVEVIVNPWNRNVVPWWLLLPQGVSGAIKRRGGAVPFRELGWRPMALGSARRTSAGRLPFKAIIHVAGIDLVWRASERSIRDSVHSAFKLALGHGDESIAFPIIGAGSGGMKETAAEAVLLQAIAEANAPIATTVVRYRRA